MIYLKRMADKISSAYQIAHICWLICIHANPEVQQFLQQKYIISLIITETYHLINSNIT